MVIEVATPADVLADSIARRLVGLDEDEAREVAKVWAVGMMNGFPATLTNALTELLQVPPELIPFLLHLKDRPRDFSMLSIFADWLDDKGKKELADKYRRLIPASGEVLVWYYPRGANGPDVKKSLVLIAEAVTAHLASLGREVMHVVLPHGCDLSTAEDAIKRAMKVSGVEKTPGTF